MMNGWIFQLAISEQVVVSDPLKSAEARYRENDWRIFSIDWA